MFICRAADPQQPGEGRVRRPGARVERREDGGRGPEHVDDDDRRPVERARVQAGRGEGDGEAQSV